MTVLLAGAVAGGVHEIHVHVEIKLERLRMW
jgi:hypothetical protein